LRLVISSHHEHWQDQVCWMKAVLADQGSAELVTA
jgi:hypothetical protein